MRFNVMVFGFVAVLGLAFAAQAEARDRCPAWRPCGPGNSWTGNRWLPQGFYGADFRPACANHDACLASGNFSRRECDEQFHQNMLNACANSSNPRACARQAHKYYAAARLFGWMYR